MKGTKIQSLQLALESGEVMTPLKAWDRWMMAHNTYHRSIHSLKAKGMLIRSQLVTLSKGVTFSIHWFETKRESFICSHCGKAFPEGFKHHCTGADE